MIEKNETYGNLTEQTFFGAYQCDNIGLQTGFPKVTFNNSNLL